MKRLIGITGGLLILLVLILALIPASRDEIHWQLVSLKKETGGFEEYLKSWPKGRHREEARNIIDSLYWLEATDSATIQAFERYIESYQDGRYLSEAKGSLDSLRWHEAKTANTVRGYLEYGRRHPEGRYLKDAEKNSAALRANNEVFRGALKTGTLASLNQFLKDYPGHIKEAEAQQVVKEIAEGRDVVDLISEKKIKVKAKGNSIRYVDVQLRRLIEYPVTVRIPVGTFFVSNRRSTQNMVATNSSSVSLADSDWHRVSVSTACANRPKNIPGSGDSFTIRRSPYQKELTKLMPVLEEARVDFSIHQAAVWIVTDNADYNDLGVLVSGFGGFGPRVIQELDATKAMQICVDAGIDITRKAIWRDRRRIINGLEEEEVEIQKRSIGKPFNQIKLESLEITGAKKWLEEHR